LLNAQEETLGSVKYLNREVSAQKDLDLLKAHIVGLKGVKEYV